MLMRIPPRRGTRAAGWMGWLALALVLAVVPAARTEAQGVTDELEELFGLTPEEPAEAPPEAPPEEAPAEALPTEAPPTEAPPIEAGPVAPPAPETEDEITATGYGDAGLPVTVAGARLQNDWRLLVHYFKLARFDLAREYGEKVLAANPEPRTVLALAESLSTGYSLLVKMVTVEDMGDVPARLLALADEGMRMKRTDKERIQANLLRLGENPRAYFYAMRELKYSGPYVVPYALAVLQAPSKTDLHPLVLRALEEIGRPVVLPLLASLDTDSAPLKEKIVRVLGRIGYAVALPHLKAVVENTSDGPAVKTAATDAIIQIADEAVLRVPAKTLYVELAEKYYYGRIIVADTRLATTDVFEWVEGTGLLYRAAPSKAVNEILAARACADALRADPEALAAVSLWVASLMQMEAELDGMTAREADPFLPDDMPTVDFFARAVGQQHLYKVLDRALRDRKPAVASRAGRALEDVANEEFLLLYGQADVGSPLVMALTYPDQRVRFSAAFALQAIRPTTPFTGAGKVVPVLTEALNLEAHKAILLVEAEPDNRNRLMSELKEAGWNVTAAANGNDAIRLARAMPRIDALIISSRIRNIAYADVISILRSDYQTAMTPIVALSWPDDPVKAAWLEERISYLAGVEPDVTVEALEGIIRELKQEAGSLVLDAEASRTASLKAARSLQAVAMASPVYSARRARGALMEALADRPDELTIAVLQALAEIPDGAITRAMANVAVDEARSKDVRVQALESLAQAARFIGNDLRPEQIDALQELAANPDDDLRNAAGEALGGLDLNASYGAELILKHGSS